MDPPAGMQNADTGYANEPFPQEGSPDLCLELGGYGGLYWWCELSSTRPVRTLSLQVLRIDHPEERGL